MKAEVETLPDATAVMHQAISVLLSEELPGAGTNPEIMAGFAMLTTRVINEIDRVREEELVLLRLLYDAVTAPVGKPLRERDIQDRRRAYETWQTQP